VHGGGLVAILDAVTRALGTGDEPRVIEGRLTSSVPVATALVLEGSARAEGAVVTILQDGQTLTSASVRRSATAPVAAPPARDSRDGTALPGSDDCLACGVHNSTRTASGRAWCLVGPGDWTTPGPTPRSPRCCSTRWRGGWARW